MTLTIASVGERALIERIRARVEAVAGPSRPDIPVGIGDDAAVVAPARGRFEALTTDSLVEGVHFRLDWSSAAAVGRKAVLVNLSDLAAMGARPRALLMSLCLPDHFAIDDFDACVNAIVDEAHRAGAALAGGNISRSSGPLMVTITAVGSVHPRRILTRGGGRIHDELYVTGSVGGAAAGLAILEAGLARPALSGGQLACIERYERPPSLLRFAARVSSDRAAGACIDLSDGLADAVRQLAGRSGCGAVIRGDLVPIDEAARDWWIAQGTDPVHAALAGGEDYELLFAVPARKRRAFLAAARRTGTRVTRIGAVTAEGLRLLRGEAEEPIGPGFAHFRS